MERGSSRDGRRKESRAPRIERAMADALPKRAILIVNADKPEGRGGVRGGARQAGGRRARADRRACRPRSRGDGAGGQGRDRQGADGHRRRRRRVAVVDGRPFRRQGHGVRGAAAGHRQQLRPDARPSARPRRRDRRHRLRAGASGSTSACINGDYFANAAALGLSPLIADTVPHGLKRYLGMVGYLHLGGARGVPVPPVPAARHARRWDDRQDAGRPRCGSPTAAHHGGVELVEKPELDSGEMVIQAVTGQEPVPGLAWSWFATLFKLRRRDQTVTEWRGRQHDRSTPGRARRSASTARLRRRPRSTVEVRPRRDRGGGAEGMIRRLPEPAREALRRGSCLAGELPSRASAADSRSASAACASWSARAFSTASGLARSVKDGLASRAARLSRSFSAAATAFDRRARSASRSIAPSSGKAIVTPPTTICAEPGGTASAATGAPSLAMRASVGRILVEPLEHRGVAADDMRHQRWRSTEC